MPWDDTAMKRRLPGIKPLLVATTTLFVACSSTTGATSPEPPGSTPSTTNAPPSGTGAPAADSADLGRTWQDATPANVDSSDIVALDIDRWPSAEVVIGTGDRLQLAITDDGTTWRVGKAIDASFPDGFGQVSVDFTNGSDGFVEVQLPSSSASSAGMLLSTVDGGTSWKKLETPVGGAITFSSPTSGWLTGGPLGELLYRTTDAGASWAQVIIDPPADAKGHIAAPGLPTFVQNAAIMPVRFFVNGGGPLLLGFYRSTDGGSNWEQVGDIQTIATEGILAPAAMSDDLWAAVSLDPSAVLVSEDQGKMVNLVPGPKNVDLSHVINLSVGDGRAIWLETSTSSCEQFKSDCAIEGALWSSMDAGATWAQVQP